MKRDLSPARNRWGMTLVETLMVLSILVLLMALVVPAFNSLTKGRALNRGGTLVDSLAHLARQNSMSKNAMTALLLVTDPAAPSRNRQLALMELVPPVNGAKPQSSDWKQLGPWEKLPEGIVVDLCDTDEAPTSKPFPDFPQIRADGKVLQKWKYLIFLPGGNLAKDQSVQFRLVEGIFTGAGDLPAYTHSGSDGQPANHYTITIIAATGRTKIDRP